MNEWIVNCKILFFFILPITIKTIQYNNYSIVIKIMKTYEKAQIAQVSERQLSRLRNGHPVRVELGSGGPTIPVTADQLKKLQRAKAKGSAYTISLDPYACMIMKGKVSDDMVGAGWFSDMKDKFVRGKEKVKKFVKDTGLDSIINPGLQLAKRHAREGLAKAREKIANSDNSTVKDMDYILNPLVSVAGRAVDAIPDDVDGFGRKRKVPRRRAVGKGFLGDALRSGSSWVIDRGLKAVGMGARGRKKKAPTRGRFGRVGRGGALYNAGY